MRIAALCILAFSLTSLTMTGQGHGKGKSKPGKESDTQTAGIPAGVADLRFSTSDIRIISNYYGSRPQQLPPGLQKKVQRGGTLPPGWQKKVQVLPEDLERQLPRVPAGCRRVVSGPVAMLINDATNVVLDILELTR